MKCPRNKFTGLDYSEDVEEQKKKICSFCRDFLEDKPWGEHCDAHLICLITGKRLGKEALEKISKSERATTTHSLSDEGQKVFNSRLDKLKKQSKRPLW